MESGNRVQGGGFMAIAKRASAGLFGTIATTAAVLALSVAPALASTTLTVTVKGGGSFTAKATKTVLKDGLIAVTCTSSGSTPASSASGNIPSGTKRGHSPVKIGTAPKLKFNNCTGPTGAVDTTVKPHPYITSI